MVVICAQAGIPRGPQGGDTGWGGAGIPNPADDAVLVSLGRMNRILNIDPIDYTITLEAGCILADVQAAAAKVAAKVSAAKARAVGKAAPVRVVKGKEVARAKVARVIVVDAHLARADLRVRQQNRMATRQRKRQPAAIVAAPNWLLAGGKCD